MQEMQPMLYFKKERIMRKKTLALFLTCVLAAGMLAEVAELIDAIYVQERTDKTDEQCAAAKEAWDKLTDAQKALVSGENADPDYFGRDTGDASKDDPLNHSGSKSGLGSPQGIYRTDHYQSRTGKRWREDRQRRPGITESG